VASRWPPGRRGLHLLDRGTTVRWLGNVGQRDPHCKGGSMARGWGGFGGGVPATGSSSGGNDGGGDILEHLEANWG
jgi:hypothetical protein